MGCPKRSRGIYNHCISPQSHRNLKGQSRRQCKDIGKKAELIPHQCQLSPGESYYFTVRAYDPEGNILSCKIKWSATGGKVNSKGYYRAGQVSGKYKISAYLTEYEVNLTARITIGAKFAYKQLGKETARFVARGDLSPEDLKIFFRDKLFFRSYSEITDFKTGFLKGYGVGRSQEASQIVLITWRQALKELGTMYANTHKSNNISDEDLIKVMKKNVVPLNFLERQYFRRGFIEGYNSFQAYGLYRRLWAKALQK